MQVQRQELAAGLLLAQVQHGLADVVVAQPFEVVQAPPARDIRYGFDIKDEYIHESGFRKKESPRRARALVG